MKRALPALLVALLAGCTSPELCDEPAIKILAAFPGLTYVDGDPAAGTTDMVSLPLLTYSTSEQRGTRETTRTYVLPLLARFEQTDRRLQVEWSAAPQGPPPQDGWWGKRRDRRLSPRKAPRRPSAAPEPAPEERSPEGARPAAAPPGPAARPAPAVRRGGVTPAGAGPHRSARPSAHTGARAPASAPAAAATATAARQDDRLVLRLEGAGTVERLRPQQHTSIDLLFPFLALETERPAVALVRHGGPEGRQAIYKVGRTRDSFRLLPLVSFERSAERTSFMFWPLFSGYERDETGSYLRLLWFFKIPLG